MTTLNDLMKLVYNYVIEYPNDTFGETEHAALERALEAVVRDAELWRAYKARKDAAIAAGMGRNPLRQEIKPDIKQAAPAITDDKQAGGT